MLMSDESEASRETVRSFSTRPEKKTVLSQITQHYGDSVREKTMTWVTGVTLGIALLGAVLGIINTWHQIRKDRVRLHVAPKILRLIQADQISGPQLCIEVINLSTFPVTISGVGFRTRGHDVALVHPIFLDQGSWPRRLDPRQSVSAFFNEEWRKDQDLKHVQWAIATTQCGVTCCGTVKQLKKQIRDLEDRESRGSK